MKPLRSASALIATSVIATGCAGGGGASGGWFDDVRVERKPATAQTETESDPCNSFGAFILGFAGASCTSKRDQELYLAHLNRPYVPHPLNVRTQMNYGLDGDFLQPQTYAGMPDGPYVAAEVQIQYDAAGRLALFEPGGLHAPGTTSAGFASLAAAGLPWLDAGSSQVAGAPASPFTTGPDAQVALVANPHALGWNYQSFGVWNTASAGGGAMHASSFGVPTPASAVPTSGTATFTGKLAGLYVSPSGQGSAAAADLSVRADFRTRSLVFGSSGTVVTRDLRAPVAAPGLNLSGTLTYQPGSNAFSGTLRNAAGTMSGTTSGKFYGPAAQELGGAFNLRASGTSEAFTGAYGAKR
jgi:hypothetical protein